MLEGEVRVKKRSSPYANTSEVDSRREGEVVIDETRATYVSVYRQSPDFLRILYHTSRTWY